MLNDNMDRRFYTVDKRFEEMENRLMKVEMAVEHTIPQKIEALLGGYQLANEATEEAAQDMEMIKSKLAM